MSIEVTCGRDRLSLRVFAVCLDAGINMAEVDEAQ